ncbi:MAG: DUF2804 domain-containing protein [Clostridia bacterium]|nr:DUF2804 domain-containing protein [Clostridia bacterium]
MQNEIRTRAEIPGKNGTIENPGFARTEILDYTRENIKAPWYRKKEWDYYLFTNDSFALAFTISDLGYIGLLSASFIDLKTATEHTESDLFVFPKGKAFGLGTKVADANGECHTKRLNMSFKNDGDHRHISCDFKNFDGDKNLTAELDVYEPDMEAMYIATPWAEKETAFYYNCKRNCLEASGSVSYGDRTEKLERKTSLGCLDWGRGVWTYDNTWYWGTGSGRIGDEAFGFNLGYGFSDRSSASENCLYYKGKIHKLDEITFNIPKDTNGKFLFTNPWTITSNDEKFYGDFAPILDRAAEMNYAVIISSQHQVFGKMTGWAITEDGEKLEFKDFICALEVVRNKY